jgi:hypothetical protein
VSTLLNNTVGGYNTAIGYSSLLANKNGNYNTVIGAGAGFANKSGDNNVYIGHNAGLGNVSGNRNIFIGDGAGAFETGSGYLYIENSNAKKTNALIYGDFYKDSLRINGDLSVRDDVVLDGELVIAEKTKIRNGEESTSNSGGYLIIGEESGRNLSMDNNEILARYKGEGSNLYVQNGAGTGNTIINSNEGNVGIGLTKPTAKLHVGGDVKVSGSISSKKDFKYDSPKTYYYQLSPASFKVVALNSDSYLVTNTQSIYLKHDNSIIINFYYGKALAPMNLPDGAIIKNAKLYYRIFNDGGGWADIYCTLYRRNITTPNNAEVMCQFHEKTPTGGSYNPKIISSIAGNVVDNQNYIYFMKIHLSESEGLNENTDNVEFYGVTIEYTLDKVTQ